MMKKIFLLPPFQVKKIFCISITIFIATIVSHYYSFSHEYWLLLTAFFMSLTTQGAPIQHSLQIFLFTLIAFILAKILFTLIGPVSIIYIIYGIYFIAINYLLFLFRPHSFHNLFLILSFTIVLLIAILVPPVKMNMQNYFYDIVLGALIAILCVKLLMGWSITKDFQRDLGHFLQSLSSYTEAMISFLLNDNVENNAINIKRIALQEEFIQPNQYPEWVYEQGFNPGLRAGFRYFLIQLERLTDLYFSLHHFLSRGIEDGMLNAIRESLVDCMKNNNALLLSLRQYFIQQSFANHMEDFTSDILLLEKVAGKLMPQSIELLDVSPEYIVLAAIVRDIKDIRQILLKLNAALPTTNY